MIFRRRLATGVVAAAFAGVFVAGPVFAQQPQNTVAKLKEVTGNVLVSLGDAMVAGTNDQRLPLGTRVVTTAGAQVTINYDVGCDVTLKEKRKLVLVPRETPLSLVHLRNMTQAAEAGAVVLPAAPGFYQRPTQVGELVDFIVQRIVDHLGLEIRLLKPWQG